MTGYTDKLPSGDWEYRKIRLSDGCGENSVFSTVVRGYDLHKLEAIWEMSVNTKAHWFIVGDTHFDGFGAAISEKGLTALKECDVRF